MVKTIQDEFDDWLDGIIVQKTRQQIAAELGCDLKSLEWAFCAGYVHGEQAAMVRREDKTRAE